VISRSVAAQIAVSGVRSLLVRACSGSSVTLSVGSPPLHARSGSSDDMTSTGTIPKYSFTGAYSDASIVTAEKRAARWAGAKFRQEENL
jgi:hypothetical protein